MEIASQHSRQTGSVTWLRTSGRQDHLKPWQRWEEKPALNEMIHLPSQSRHPQHTFELSSMVFTWVLTPNSGKCSYSLVFASVFSMGCWPEPSLLQVLWTTLLFLFKKSPLCHVATCHPTTGLCARVPAYRRKMTLFFLLSSRLRFAACLPWSFSFRCLQNFHHTPKQVNGFPLMFFISK